MKTINPMVDDESNCGVVLPVLLKLVVQLSPVHVPDGDGEPVVGFTFGCGNITGPPRELPPDELPPTGVCGFGDGSVHMLPVGESTHPFGAVVGGAIVGFPLDGGVIHENVDGPICTDC